MVLHDLWVRLSSSIWTQTALLLSSITFFNTIFFAVVLFIWSMNRQTQIRPSRSQKNIKREEYAKFKSQKFDSDKDENNEHLDSFQFEVKSNNQSRLEGDQFLMSRDWERQHARKEILRNFSMDFSEICDHEHTAHNDYDIDKEFSPPNIARGPRSSPISALRDTRRAIREDILTFVSKMNIFSYLSDDAFKEILPCMKYIDIAEVGTPITHSNSDNCGDSFKLSDTENSILDGSLYIVISGCVHCSCQFDDIYVSSSQQTSLQFKVGPGELVTSQLAMLSDLIQWHQEKYGTFVNTQINTHPVRVTAYTVESNTRLVYIPSSSFLSILEKFPDEVHQIAQTILGRIQRVTTQTLVKSLGLINEVISQKHLNPKVDMRHGSTDEEWKEIINKCRLECDRLCDEYVNNRKTSKPSITHIIVPEETNQNTATLAAWQLGTKTREDIEMIQKSSSIIAVTPGAVVLHAGTKSKFIYFVIGGEIEIGNYITSVGEKGLEKSLRRPMDSLRQLPFELHDEENVSFQVSQIVKHGAIVSLLSAFTGEVSMVSIRASPETHLRSYIVQIPIDVYLSLVTRNTSVFIQSLGTILRENFSPLVHLLDWGLRWRDLQAGSLLACRGEPCQSLWVVLNGRLRTGDKINVDRSKKYELGRGACIGEIQVLTGEAWPHDVYAIRNSELAELPVGVLEFIMKLFPSCGIHFARVIANQVQRQYMGKENISVANSDNQLPSYKLSVATIAIVPVCFEHNIVEASKFCETVVNGLLKIAPCSLVTKTHIKQKMGKVDNVKNFIDVLKLARLLGDIEENNRLVVFQAESVFNSWTKTCIEHSDCVMLVVDSNMTPSCSQIALFLSKLQRNYLVMKRVELVLLISEQESPRDNDSEPLSKNMNEWVETLPFSFSISVITTFKGRTENTKANEVNRMCRRITGCSVGLALGGGGARGIAHLGVIKAIIESGISVDMVGGTSQGAFVGVSLASFLFFATLLSICLKLFYYFRRHYMPNIPMILTNFFARHV